MKVFKKTTAFKPSPTPSQYVRVCDACAVVPPFAYRQLKERKDIFVKMSTG